MGLIDREKVIRGLISCMIPGTGGCRDCPYSENGLCQQSMAEDAISLLKAQEARLLTIEDFTPEKLQNLHHVWVEIRPGFYSGKTDEYYGGKPYPAVLTGWFGIRCNGIGNVVSVKIPGGYDTVLHVENDYNDGYGVKWRVWTQEPTKEQLGATPWVN